MVLRVIPQLASNIIDKWPRFTKVISQKRLKFWLGDGISILMAIIVLGTIIANCLIEKKCSKRGMIGPNNPYYIEIIFVLLIKVIAVHMQFSII